jgi:hypothetical protein
MIKYEMKCASWLPIVRQARSTIASGGKVIAKKSAE